MKLVLINSSLYCSPECAQDSHNASPDDKRLETLLPHRPSNQLFDLLLGRACCDGCGFNLEDLDARRAAEDAARLQRERQGRSPIDMMRGIKVLALAWFLWSFEPPQSYFTDSAASYWRPVSEFQDIPAVNMSTSAAGLLAAPGILIPARPASTQCHERAATLSKSAKPFQRYECWPGSHDPRAFPMR